MCQYYIAMKSKREILYFEEDSDDYSENDEYENEEEISGGIRPSQYVQSGNNNSSFEGGGKKMKTVKKIGLAVAKKVFKEAKPIVIAEGKRALQQGLQRMLASEEQQSGAGLIPETKRGRGRPKKVLNKYNDDLGHIIDSAYRKQGGNLVLGKKSKKLTDELILHGIHSGIEYAEAQSGGKIKFGKVMKKVAKSPITKEIIHQGVRTGLAYATSGMSEVGQQHQEGGKFKVGRALKKVSKNPIVRQVGNELLSQGIDAGVTYALGAGKPRKIGGGSTKRGEIVKQVMKEQGLSLPQASKFVKENNLY